MFTFLLSFGGAEGEEYFLEPFHGGGLEGGRKEIPYNVKYY